MSYKIKIATDFTNAPGPDKEENGKNSGEKFLNVLLEPQYVKARAQGEKLVVDLDGAFGYVTAFLREAFGGLQKRHIEDKVDEWLIIISNDQPSRYDRILEYIKGEQK